MNNKLKMENITTITKACIWYTQWKLGSLMTAIIEVIDDENINTRVLERLELQFNMLYELQKDFGTNDDDFDKDVIYKAWLVARQIIKILNENKN